MKSEPLKDIFLLIKEISLFHAPINLRENRPFLHPFYFRADQVRENKWGAKIRGIKVIHLILQISKRILLRSSLT